MQTLPPNFTVTPNLLHDRVIAITGAGSGIGRMLAIGCAQHGATVILMGRHVNKLEAVYDEIEALDAPQAAIVPINLEGATDTDYTHIANQIDKHFGRLDGLVHNAAQLGARTPISNYDSSTWQRVLHVNVTAPFMLTKALLPLLGRADHASILFTGSSVGFEGRAYWGAYAAAKAAQENLMQTLAQELEGTSSIRANSINPGATRTAMRAEAYPAENPKDVKSPSALLPLYLYLLSDASIGEQGQAFGF